MISPTKRFAFVGGPIALMVIACALCCMGGCSGRSTTVRNVDTRLARLSKSARADYAEGHVDQALDGYRKALHRAWAMDDPEESGIAAYNLAACYVSLESFDQAKDWLLDARIALCRSKTSTANAWILESKIAQREYRYEDASRYLQLASCAGPDCDPSGGWCACGPRDPCRDSCLANIPCVGDRIAERTAARECEGDFQAQIELGHARLAAEQFDAVTATKHFQRACRLVGDPCNHDLQSELQNVAAYIHLARGEFLKAASHFDNDVDHLRAAGNFREIPGSLRMSAAAYEQAGHFSLAATRMGRVSRVLLGRGEVTQAWEALQLASDLALVDSNEPVSISLGLTAQEITRVLSADDAEATNASKAPEVVADEANLEMVQSDLERSGDTDTDGAEIDELESSFLEGPALRPSM